MNSDLDNNLAVRNGCSGIAIVFFVLALLAALATIVYASLLLISAL